MNEIKMTKEAFESRVEFATRNIINTLYSAELIDSQRYAIAAILNRVARTLEAPRAAEQNIAVCENLFKEHLNGNRV